MIQTIEEIAIIEEKLSESEFAGLYDEQDFYLILILYIRKSSNLIKTN